MPTREQVQELAHRLHALAGGPELRRTAAARLLARLHPTEASELLQHLLDLSRLGSEPARCVLHSFVSAQGIEAAGLVPEDATPAMQMDPDEAARNDARLFTESLGHLKTKARLTRDPDEMARLAAASDASVVRNLLLNPRMTEQVAVRIAARRPARPEPLLEIWRTPKWIARHAVKRALVFNPYLPPEVGAKIVPLLGQADWHELASTPGVHPALRAQARQLLSAPRPTQAG